MINIQISIEAQM